MVKYSFVELQMYCSDFCYLKAFCVHCLSSVIWRCWLGGRKGIWPVKTKWWGTGMVICLKRGANDLHMVQLMSPLPIIFCSSKIQNGLPFWCQLTQVVLGKRLLNGSSVVVVCVYCRNITVAVIIGFLFTIMFPITFCTTIETFFLKQWNPTTEYSPRGNIRVSNRTGTADWQWNCWNIDLFCRFYSNNSNRCLSRTKCFGAYLLWHIRETDQRCTL